MNGALHTAAAKVNAVAWTAIPTPAGSLFAPAGNASDGGAADAYSDAREVQTIRSFTDE